MSNVSFTEEYLEDSDLQRICIDLAKQSTIKSLNLSDNCFTNIQPLIDVAESLSSLKVLKLNDNEFNSSVSSQLPKLLSLLPNLQELEVRNCNLSEALVRPFCEALSTHKSLVMLDLSSNRLGDSICQELQRTLELNRTLQKIVMQDCEISPRGMSFIGKWISCMRVVC
ncbi:hypothetical protein GEMRC1_003269 [Eukaryota sp. GEM-RC1]